MLEQCGLERTDLLPLPFLLLVNAVKEAQSVLATNISVSPSSGWYFALSPFESILIGLIVLKLLVLRYTKIIPINLNKVFDGMLPKPQNRRKREIERERLAETMYTVIRRLDMQDCLLRSLCELQAKSNHGFKVPRETKMVLSSLSQSGWARNKTSIENEAVPKDTVEDRPVLSVFEEAVLTGWDAKLENGTECQERYFICPLNTDDLMAHFHTVDAVNVL
ncbi:unnamed protein product [Allacma fusca]|uniref:Uncharacterized protein n=1 Tax=Allacma fusca TaxID=39272 RepID=A0A8J2J8N4_9HEXA|nr:unnamed protein product [Allacma fusca]